MVVLNGMNVTFDAVLLITFITVFILINNMVASKDNYYQHHCCCYNWNANACGYGNQY